jgi:hypothetical protein
MKCCSRCQVMKEPSQFYVRRKSADGLQNDCKECSKERVRLWRRRVARLRRAMWGESRQPANIEALLVQLGVPCGTVNSCEKR